jgi:hypothetical protein
MITHFRHTTVGRTPLEEWPARRRDLYLTTHNTHTRQTSMPPVGFETTILVSERPQTHALDRTATGIGPSATLSTTNPKWTSLWSNPGLRDGFCNCYETKTRRNKSGGRHKETVIDQLALYPAIDEGGFARVPKAASAGKNAQGQNCAWPLGWQTAQSACDRKVNNFPV